jgi:hypothetical protein
LGETLRQAVEAQAAAHVRGDDAAFASYMTPQALLQLRGNGHVRPRRFVVLAVDERDSVGQTAVRYVGRGSYVLRQRWEQRDGLWKTIDARRPAEEMKRPLLQRLLGRTGAHTGEQA